MTTKFKPDLKKTTEKKPKYDLRRAYQQKLKANPKSGQSLPQRPPTGEYNTFIEIWSERQHISFLTGEVIYENPGTLMFVNCFAHLLSKKNYPKFRLNKENIILLTPHQHFILDFGTESMRKKYEEQHGCSFDRIFELRDKLKKQYEEL